MAEWTDRIDAYLDGELPADEAAKLRAWINAAPANARQFADRALLQHEVRSILKRDRMQTVQNPRQVLQELLELEQNAQAQLVHLHTQPAQRFAGVRQFGMLLANPYTISGIAALFILTASLLLIFQGGGEEPANEGPATIAEQPERPIESLQTVATLTAQRDAVWAEGASAPGSPLRAGQRLTLTQGLAEITTMNGAVAILEAPCRIRLIDHGNQLFLEQGQLAAYVPPSATGFTVETPNAQFVDVGTEFAVAVTREGQSVAKVFRGEIRAGARSESSDTPARFESLLADQTCRIDADGAKVHVDVPIQVALSQPTELIDRVRASATDQLVVTASPDRPAVDAHDIAQLNGGNKLRAPNNPADPGEAGDEANWVFGFDRPAQGQTFTTGSNPAGYTLNALTLQCASNGYFSGAYANQTDIRYRLRVHELDDTTQLASKLLDRFATVRDVVPELGHNQRNTLNSPTAGQYVTFSGFAVRLQPNTRYAIDLCVVSGADLGWRLNANTDTNSYPGGTAYSSGDNGTPDQQTVTRTGDRVFHLDLASAIDEGGTP